MSYAVLVVVVVAATATVDYSHARYVSALLDGRRHAAACWSVAQWMAASVGFVVAIRVSLWMLPAEAFGLYLGTWLGSRRDVRAVPSGS